MYVFYSLYKDLRRRRFHSSWFIPLEQVLLVPFQMGTRAELVCWPLIMMLSRQPVHMNRYLGRIQCFEADSMVPCPKIDTP